MRNSPTLWVQNPSSPFTIQKQILHLNLLFSFTALIDSRADGNFRSVAERLQLQLCELSNPLHFSCHAHHQLPALTSHLFHDHKLLHNPSFLWFWGISMMHCTGQLTGQPTVSCSHNPEPVLCLSRALNVILRWLLLTYTSMTYMFLAKPEPPNISTHEKISQLPNHLKLNFPNLPLLDERTSQKASEKPSP